MSQSFEWASKIPCRNMQIHGYCKWENKGCSFNHDVRPGTGGKSPSTPSTPNSPKPKFNFNTPAFTPSNPGAPSSGGTPSSSSSNLGRSASGFPQGPAAQHQQSTPRQQQPAGPQSSQPTLLAPESAPVFTPTSPDVQSATSMSVSGSQMSQAPMSASMSQLGQLPAQLAPQPVDPFYQQTNLFPMNYHLYAPQPPPHVDLNKSANERTVGDLFIPNDLREYLQQRNEASLQQIPNNQLNLPLHVGPYHSLYPIDKHYENNDSIYGYPQTVFKCMSNRDGRLYCMRRLEGVPITSGRFLEPIKLWSQIKSANIVRVYDAFSTKAFGDISLILIYDYYPLSLNLMETHFYRIGNRDPELITEDILWSYMVQLTNATLAIHAKDFWVGDYDPSKIIVTSKTRARLSACAVSDIVDLAKNNHNNQKDAEAAERERALRVPHEQQNDLCRFGHLLLNLAKSTNVIKDVTDPVEIVKLLNYSDQFKTVLQYMLTPDANWERFQQLLAPHILRVCDGMENATDYFEANLTKEVENSRLVRLLAKLDVISERPEFLKDGSWSETGERYPVKLFKDFVFHQVDKNGKPVVDLAHIINCLNKLDAGVDENVLLVSPDEMTCLIMSYKQLKELVEKSFRQVVGR